MRYYLLVGIHREQVSLISACALHFVLVSISTGVPQISFCKLSQTISENEQANLAL